MAGRCGGAREDAVEQAPIVLVAADQPDARRSLAAHLRLDHYVVLCTGSAAVAREAIEDNTIALVIIDLTHEWAEGVDFRRVLCSSSDARALAVLVLMDAECTRECDDAQLLQDEVLRTPFTWDKLRARVRILLRDAVYTRRPSRFVAASSRTLDSQLAAGDLFIDVGQREVRFKGQTIVLTARMFDLLVFLASHPGELLSKQEILTSVWGYVPAGGTQTVHVHIRWLRERLERDPAHPEQIVTIPHQGYRFIPAATQPSTPVEDLPTSSAD
jgi:two-component system response regulator VicR